MRGRLNHTFDFWIYALQLSPMFPSNKRYFLGSQMVYFSSNSRLFSFLLIALFHGSQISRVLEQFSFCKSLIKNNVTSFRASSTIYRLPSASTVSVLVWWSIQSMEIQMNLWLEKFTFEFRLLQIEITITDVLECVYTTLYLFDDLLLLKKRFFFCRYVLQQRNHELSFQTQ